MPPTGATRGRINCSSTILITINKSKNKTNYKRPQLRRKHFGRGRFSVVASTNTLWNALFDNAKSANVSMPFYHHFKTRPLTWLTVKMTILKNFQ